MDIFYNCLQYNKNYTMNTVKYILYASLHPATLHALASSNQPELQISCIPAFYVIIQIRLDLTNNVQPIKKNNFNVIKLFWHIHINTIHLKSNSFFGLIRQLDFLVSNKIQETAGKSETKINVSKKMQIQSPKASPNVPRIFSIPIVARLPYH